MSSTKKIRIALVGCGRISSSHLESISKLSKEAEIAAVCDCVKQRAEEAGEKYNAQVFTDYDKMLEKAECDMVSIATPSGLHPKMGVKAARSGRHVLTEKPMAISLKGADSLISECDKAGVKLFVVKQNRLNTTMQILKNAADKGRFGKIYAAHVNVFWQRPQEYYDMAPWRGTWALDGGAFMNQASHYVDSLQWLVGDVSEVMAITGTLARKTEAEDTGSAVLKFACGAIGSINVTMLAYPKNIEGSVTVIGEKGTVKVGGVAINKIEHWEFSSYDDDDKLIEQSNYSPPNVYGFGHLPYYKNVLSILNGQKAPETDGREGRKSLEIILAIYKSSEIRASVKLPREKSQEN
ncbi:MAG: Gfo/Idh/MocA family oxidoreductase [Victivallales bacterium]|nr:Gfo/Idh/MocA family oxidoreductase [Victivallales bacterium]